MNVKEHIEAGHYPTDDKGRPLVPTKDGRTYCILADDLPTSLPIVGYCTSSPDIISRQKHDGNYLLPPTPRKVKVSRWAEIETATGWTSSTWQVRGEVQPREGCVIVELSGEYEEPWS